MQIGEFTFRTKDKGFLQPEPAPVNPGGIASFVPEPASQLPDAAARAGRVQTLYLEGADRVLWVHGASNQNTGQAAPNTSNKQLAGVDYTTMQPVVIQRTRSIQHYDVQGRHQAANSYKGGASFFAKGIGFGPTAGRGSATPSAPGGGPTIGRPPPRFPFVLRVPRFSTLPRTEQSHPASLSRPGVRLPGGGSSSLSNLAPNIITPPQGV